MRHLIPRCPVIPFSLLFGVFFYSSFASSTPRSYLSRHSSLSVEDFASDVLISPDKWFTCGFYPVGTNAYSFSIWYTNLTDKSVVWMANRDRPVNGRRSKVLLRRDGKMVLTDADGSIVWSTNTTGTGVKAELLNTGNLVLRDRYGNISWQSFDSPTDTLLPLQLLTKNTRLISAKAKGQYSSGYYILYFDNDNVLRLMYEGPDITSVYWPNPEMGVFRNNRTSYNRSRIAVLDEMGSFSSSDNTGFYASDLSYGIRRRLTMDYDGNLRLYSLNESARLWVVTWESLPQHCIARGLCGKNGICVYTPEATCSCLPGYRRSDPSNWNKGCEPMFKRSCDNPQDVQFVELLHTEFSGFDFNLAYSIPLESCKELCFNMCSCEAFTYRISGDPFCYLKASLFNGYSTPNFPGSVYLKLPKSLKISETSTHIGSSKLTCGTNSTEPLVSQSGNYKLKNKTTWIYLYSFALSIGVIEALIIALGWWLFFSRNEMSRLMKDGYRVMFSQFRKFTYAELNKATKKFKDELGRGGSGAVYKGVLGDNRVVAVKKLGDVIEGAEEFWAEVSTFGRINHMNVVRMWGFCVEETHRLLVYDYVENGSLDKHLFSNAIICRNSKTSFLNWTDRFRIAIGTAKGLAYLHHECLEWVIHCDVKPENILLDKDFEPKIADFGLSKFSQRGGSGSEFSRIRGTKGYMAPEWALNLPITAMVDVYSYGVVLLEIVKGTRLFNWVVVDGEEEAEITRFLKMVKKKIESTEDAWVEDIVDPRLQGQFNRNQAVMMIKIGISCVEEDRSKRPTMDMVVQALIECEDDEPEIFTASNSIL
uniref:Receptor-like serine/threonine-protein kinase n=1 Tax=Nelumbo nucifera TaxID=4432 RepID=A0A822Y2S2_NELNU|nr:TPA_asm: hypothetical protein HUJ06_028020 [Nelumbo nucifera]